MLTGGITEASPVIGLDGTVYLGVNLELWAISPDGKKKWAWGTDEPIENAPVALADGSVCLSSRRGLLVTLDSQGQKIWSYYLYGYGYACPGVGPNGTLYVSDRGDYISAIPAGVPLAQSAWPRFHGNARNTGNAADGMR